MKFILFLVLLLNFGQVSAQEKIIPNNNEFIPNMLWSAPEDYFYFIAEKEMGYLHVYRGTTYIHSFPMTSGMKRGDKKREGDKKTPVGIYFLENYFSSLDLKQKYSTYEMFGNGAITLNYPNPIDKQYRNRGSNIWIHGTNQPERVKSKNTSQGCIVLNNKDFEQVISLSKEHKSVLIITDFLKFKKLEKIEKSNLFIEAHGQRVVWTENMEREYQMVE